MELLIVAALCIGLIPAMIARSKERSFLYWWIFGAALFIIALPASLIVGYPNRCPFCREPVRSDASVCPHCHHDLDGSVRKDEVLSRPLPWVRD